MALFTVQNHPGRSGSSPKPAASAEADHTAQIALKHDLPRAPTPYPQPLTAKKFADLLHPSPPLRRRKGSQTLREIFSDIHTDHSIMSMTGRDQNALGGNSQDYAAEHSNNSNAYTTPTRRGKMPETRGSQDEFPDKEKGITADTRKSNETSTSSEDQIVKPKPRSLQKAHAVLGYYDEDKITPKKSMTDLVKSPKSVRGKKSFRNLFHRKEGKEFTTSPSSSSGNTDGRKIISAPTLIDASPNAKALLSSAPSLIDGSPSAKNVVNYSRPIVRHSSSDVSNVSPAVRGRSETALYGSNPVSDPSTSPGGVNVKSGNTQVGLNAALVSQNPGLQLPNADEEQTQDYSNASTAITHTAIPKASTTETNADGSDSDSFNPSDYSGDENSVQQAVAVPIVFSGRAKLVDVRPPRGIDTAASGSRSDVGTNAISGRAKLTDREAEALGAQDAERYYRNATNAQARPANMAEDDPFIDPAYRNLLAKPANEIAAQEMARIKAVREAGNQGGGLMERMNALRAKNVAKPEVENTGVATAGPRTITGGSLLSKMRGHMKKSKKDSEQDSEEEVVRKVQADVERGLREENEIHARIKAKMAAKAAASGGVPGAGIPRIDYGAPSLHTALGGCGPTDEERARAHVLAGSTGGRVPDNEDNATARGHLEGY